MIKEITNTRELEKSVDVIRKSFATVAEEFGITQENCPTNPAFIKTEHLIELLEKGAKLFVLSASAEQVGFMAVEKEVDTVFCVRRLAVLPEHRHRGFGRALMEFACDYARRERGERVTVRIMHNNLQLKEWYKTLGFVVTGTKQFAQLPFDVCYMEKDMSGP
jgi:ribosomal protein S18 acetylase RimI-like enzyme